MDEGKLKAILQHEIDGSIGYLESETTLDRSQALEAYQRKPLGTETPGRSQIVTGEVAEVIDGAMPQLMRIFTSTDDVVRFEPRGPGDEMGAQQATEYVNWVFYTQNQGFHILHNAMKDALLQKTGVIKAYWDERVNVTKEVYQDLTDNELVLLLSDGTMEILEQETTEEQTQDGMPMRSHTVRVAKKTVTGDVRVEVIPPEEFLISKRATTVEDAPFVAHRQMMPRSDLVAMGFDADVVSSIPSYDDMLNSSERSARFSNGERPDQRNSLDDSMQELEVIEAYIRVDYDDDGIAEMRRVVISGNEILSNEETDYVPFHTLCPIPIPHKFFGHSLADRTMDIYQIKTTVMRQMLDNLFLTNAARVGAVEGQVNLEDLSNVTPGGIVRMKSPNAVVPMVVSPVMQQAFPMLSYLDEVQAKRTGVSDAQQGLNPDVLQNVTAAAIAATTSAAGGKLELIARIFAETGLRTLFKGILQLVCKYQDKPRIIRLRGQYVEMDPRMWSNQYDCSINVGLGTGNRQEQMAMLQMIMAKQEQIIQAYGPSNPLVSVGQYRTTLGKFIEAAGLKDSQAFFKEVPPEVDQQLSQPQQKQPDPTVAAMMQQAQAQIQIAREKAAAEIQARREKAAAEIALEREKAAAELELKREEFLAEAQIKAAKVQAGITNNVEIPG